jgi:DNA-damage-inducible protein D
MNNLMAKQLPDAPQPVFEQIKRLDESGNEYWSARDLGKVLEYLEYRNFQPAIERAKEACQNSGHNLSDHFVDMHEMIEIGKGGKRAVESVKLSRYACYLIVQNADPGKEVVALGQTYFAVQTRLQEIRQMDEYNRLSSEDEKRLFLRNELRRHNNQLADAAKDAGVIDPVDYAVFQNFGYQGLYGGLDARAIHQKKSLKKSQHILDHICSTELAANLFRATQTDEKLRRENIRGKSKANQTHYEVGKKVRQTIKELGGTMPEDLPTEESIKKLEGVEGKKIGGKSKKSK